MLCVKSPNNIGERVFTTGGASDNRYSEGKEGLKTRCFVRGGQSPRLQSIQFEKGGTAIPPTVKTVGFLAKVL